MSYSVTHVARPLGAISSKRLSTFGDSRDENDNRQYIAPLCTMRESRMGVWGIGHFDNDDAGDWIWELEDDSTLRPVTDALAAVERSEDFLEAPDGAIALAAAEVIAASRGRAAPDLPDNVLQIVQTIALQPGRDLVSRAIQVVARIADDSELRDLWEETDDFSEWQLRLNDLMRRLEQVPG